MGKLRGHGDQKLELGRSVNAVSEWASL